MRKKNANGRALDDLRSIKTALASDELRQRRSELVEVAPLRAAAADAMARARAGFQRFPTRIARRLGLTPQQAAIVQEMTEAELNELAQSFAAIGEGKAS